MPSMTLTVKDELTHVRSRLLSSQIAEISMMFRFAGGLQINSGKVALHAELSHPGAARHLCELITHVFHTEPELNTVASQLRQGNHYVVRIVRDGERTARRIGLLDSYGRPVRGLPPSIMGGSKSDAAAAWRGAFLARGALVEPGRNTSLEVVCPSLEAAYGLGGLARRLDIPYRARESRGAHRVDVREAHAITELLARMGAQQSVLEWEELRQRREVRSNNNRLPTFEDANMRRSALAAVVAIVRVKRAFEILGDDVPENLKEAGQLRIEYPNDSLFSLGSRLNPPATKDAIAGRLRRLHTLADKVAKKKGIPTTMDAVEQYEMGQAAAEE